MAGVLALIRLAGPGAGGAPAQAAPVAPPIPPAESRAVVGTVDARRPAQTLIGFGAATAFFQDWIAGHPYKAEIYDAFFKGLKMDVLRLQNTYRGRPDFAAADVDIVRGARAALGHPIPILMSSWSPPADLKSNGSEKNGGTLAREDGAFVYDKYGRYWADSLAAYRRLGIVPAYVSIQNEPDWKPEYESCLFQPTETTKDGMAYAGYDKALDAVYRHLPSGRDRPKLVGPETTGIGDNKVEDFIPPGNKTELGELYAVAHHLYNGGRESDPDSFLPALRGIRKAYPDKVKMQTEFYPGDMFQTACLIHNCLVVEEANVYLYWSGIWPSDGQALINIEDPAKQAQWTYPHGWKLSDQYWALKHYSCFTAPGYRRVETTVSDPTVKMSAFLSPDRRRLTVVLLNTSATDAARFRLSLNGYSGHTATVYQTAGSERCRNIGTRPADQTLPLPPRSIVTLTLR